MKLAELLTVLDAIAPTRYAEPWDNVGLLVGDPNQPATRAILCIDYTPAVAEEAKASGCDVVIAYHPPIFAPLKRISALSVVHDAIRRGVAIWSPHTALDVADGGTNDMLADALGLAERQPLRAAAAKATHYKLVVFVPESHIDAVSRAIFDAGAGWIGNYSSCSFRSPGTGTFFGQEGASPAVGQQGKLEQVPELRIETVLPIDRVEAVIKAMRASHPYEEPAFDLIQLAAAPEGKGMGRIGTLSAPAARSAILDRIKQALAVDHLLVAGPTDGQITRAAGCAGSCGDLFEDAIRQKAELYLTGEMRHHDALKAAQAGMTVVCALHSNSERAVLRRVADRLNREAPQLTVQISKADHDPFAVR